MRGVRIFGIAAAGVLLAGCGTPHAAAPTSPIHHRKAALAPILPQALQNTYWYPKPVQRRDADTGATYLVPSSSGIEGWQGNPGAAVLAVLNQFLQAKTLDQALAEAYPSLLRQHWTRAGHDAETGPLAPGNVDSFPGSQSSYSGLVRTQYGDHIWAYSWVLAAGETGTPFAQWIKKDPALTSWYYFLDVRGKWRLYAIEN